MIQGIPIGDNLQKTGDRWCPPTMKGLLSLTSIQKLIYQAWTIQIIIRLHIVISMMSDLLRWIFYSEFLIWLSPSYLNSKELWLKLQTPLSIIRKKNTPKDKDLISEKGLENVPDKIKERNHPTLHLQLMVSGCVASVLSWTLTGGTDAKNAVNQSRLFLYHS